MDNNSIGSRLKHLVRELVDIGSGVAQRRIFTYAASSSFYLFLSLFPFVTLLCTLLPYTPLTQGVLLELMDRYLPGPLYELFSAIVEDVYDASAATVSIAAVVTVWSAALAVMSVMRGLDTAYDRDRNTNYVVFRLLACFFMVILLASLLVTLCGIVYGQKILDFIQSLLSRSWATEVIFVLLRYGRYVVMLFFLYGVFLVLYKWMPAGSRRLRDQWRGALFATVTWLAFSWVFSTYVSLSNRYGVYGILGTVLVALLWMYYCMFFLLVGGFLNKYYTDKTVE